MTHEDHEQNLQNFPANKLAASGVTRRKFLGTTIQSSGVFIIGCLINGKIQILDAKAQAPDAAKPLPV
jgi:hypothetical protein